MSLEKQLQIIKQEASLFAGVETIKRSNILKNIAVLLNEKREDIKKANKIDIDKAQSQELSKAMIDRLTLTDKEIDSMIKSVLEINNQDEVVGQILEGVTRPNGLKIVKIRVPLGVVGIIYESRPNVTIDSAALCIKSGNGAVLRGGKEAFNSNKILSQIISEALEKEGINKSLIYLIDNIDRDIIRQMAQSVGLIDVIIPRGSKGLIDFVSEHARIPVVKHDRGVCHTYIDKNANYEMALSISFNAKMQRPSACNSMETLLVHEYMADNILPELAMIFKELDVDLRGCEKTMELIKCRPAIEDDWEAEYNDLILAIKVVKDIDEAIAHIRKYGSGHSEAIITSDYFASEKFLKEVDAAAVYVNASTRFTDGGEFGLGAEIGISTQKLHSRGPMGAKDLTTTKYLVYGNGQLRV